MKTGSRIDEKRMSLKYMIDFIDSEAIIDFVASMLQVIAADVDGYGKAIERLKSEV